MSDLGSWVCVVQLFVRAADLSVEVPLFAGVAHYKPRPPTPSTSTPHLSPPPDPPPV